MRKPFYELDTYTPRRSVGWRVRQLNNLMVPQAEERFADQEMTFSHWLAITSLRAGFADTCAGLSRSMNYDSGAVTRLVDQLEERGLVERKRSKSDRRVVRLSLTPAGHAMWRKLTPRLVDYWNMVLDGFTHEEIEMLLKLLARLQDRLSAEEHRTHAVME